MIKPKEKIDLKSGKYLKLWQGPNHPGITGNMSMELTVCGDEIVDCVTHVGYLHRGFEKLMERRTYIQCFPIVCRIAVPEPDYNEYGFVAAAEELAGIEIPERAKWLRNLILEMSRLASFLMWIGGQAGAFGMGTVGQWAVAHRDFMLDLFEELTGGRVYHMYIIPGGVRSPLPEGFEDRMEKVLQKVERLLHDIEIVMFNSAVFKMRAKDLAIITPDMVDRYGLVGPNARSTGLKRDTRKDQPYLFYDQLDFDVITDTKSDVYNRAYLRWREMHQSISLIRQILKQMPDSGEFHVKVPNVLHWKIPAGETYIKAESTRGEYGYYLVSDGSAYPRRVYVRGPSYPTAIPFMEDLMRGVSISDVAGINVSLHTYPPEIER